MREYKTKPTALKHIRAGENFTNKVFNRYWTDREVCMEALACQPRLFSFVQRHNPEIEWDADFVASAFLKMVDLNPDQLYLCTLRFGHYLPPEITDSRDVVLRCAGIPDSFIWDYMAPDFLLDKEICNALNLSIFREINRTSSSRAASYDQEQVAAKLFQAFPDLYVRFMKELRFSRSFAAMICKSLKTFRFAFHGLHDDEEFVLEVLKADGAIDYSLPHQCSYRIRKAARGKDFINYLETVVQAKRLDALLPHKTSVVEPTAKRLKV